MGEGKRFKGLEERKGLDVVMEGDIWGDDVGLGVIIVMHLELQLTQKCTFGEKINIVCFTFKVMFNISYLFFSLDIFLEDLKKIE